MNEDEKEEKVSAPIPKPNMTPTRISISRACGRQRMSSQEVKHSSHEQRYLAIFQPVIPKRVSIRYRSPVVGLTGNGVTSLSYMVSSAKNAIRRTTMATKATPTKYTSRNDPVRAARYPHSHGETKGDAMNPVEATDQQHEK